MQRYVWRQRSCVAPENCSAPVHVCAYAQAATTWGPCHKRHKLLTKWAVSAMQLNIPTPNTPMLIIMDCYPQRLYNHPAALHRLTCTTAVLQAQHSLCCKPCWTCQQPIIKAAPWTGVPVRAMSMSMLHILPVIQSDNHAACQHS